MSRASAAVRHPFWQALLLLVEASLFMRAQRRYFSHDPGFETRQVVSVTLASVLSGFEPPAFFT